MSLSKSLKTDTFMQPLAKILAARGRNGDTMLAHITPKEAQMLTAKGGAGSVNPDTGLLEFFDMPSFDNVQMEQPDMGALANSVSAPTVTENAGGSYDFGYQPQSQFYSDSAPAQKSSNDGLFSSPISSSSSAPASETPLTGKVGNNSISKGVDAALKTGNPDEGTGAKPEASLFDRVTGALSKYKNPIAGAALGLRGAYLAKQGQQQAQKAESRISDMATPYRTQSQDYLNRATTGNLLPSQMQALQAQRASAAQNLSSSGAESGVAAQQAESVIQQQVEKMRENLLNEGTRLAGISDDLTLQAINAGYKANQDAQAAASGFYTAMFTIMGGIANG